ncbi:hypothetical protein GCM10009801_56720 [Streptomyces albiaxialis]|uniref:Major facilitator superfamily (MFS) profile domain-containing protein n=1 Tax=Streptomyces albiaxialis TaxID=329523 RepID=A0ABP5I4D9_9ACTN
MPSSPTVERHRALGVFAATAGAGGAAGTVLGGVLTGWLGWESTFAVNVLAGLALLAPAPRLLPEGRVPGAVRPLDVPGAVTVTLGLTLLAYALVGAGESGRPAPGPLVSGAAALALLGLFARRRSPPPTARTSGRRASSPAW